MKELGIKELAACLTIFTIAAFMLKNSSNIEEKTHNRVTEINKVTQKRIEIAENIRPASEGDKKLSKSERRARITRKAREARDSKKPSL